MAEPRTSLRWDEIDKTKFFAVGTGMYSGLSILLHPITVLKIRQQVLNSSSESRDSLKHQQTLRNAFRQVMATSGVRGLFRGVGIVVSLAIPARLVYITVLEESRQEFRFALTKIMNKFGSEPAPLIASLSGGTAGGVAAMASQMLVVPMDVISQKQMVMSPGQYAKEGSVSAIVRSEINAGGYRALFRGFGLSLFTSLPTGSVWWATYSGCQHWLDDHHYVATFSHQTMVHRGITQITSGMSAAFVAATLTQPLDTVRARRQVGVPGALAVGVPASMTSLQIAQDLASTSGLRGFYRGLGPRIFHMGLWGTLLSSAYEALRHFSRRDA